ncbi:hypothetical protein PF003_g30282 [Phytophthora fragariae]|nr:hypothetical protein PF003_g30282 [Phytophthora fragariae]
MAKRYYGKRTAMPTEIPYVLLPVKQVAVVDDVRPTPELDDEEKQSLDADEDVSMSSSDESDWEIIEEFEPDESHGGACGATAARVGATATAAEDASANVASQTAGTSGSVNASGPGTASPAVTSASGAQIGSNAASNAPPARTSTGRSLRTQATPTPPATVRRSGRQRRPNSKFNPSTWLMTFTLMQCMLIGVVNDILNPTTRTEALASEHAEGWSAAVDAEYAALIANGTWELVARPKPRKGRRKPNILTSVWVLVAKRNERGEVERLKARLAIRGFMQKFGIDYLATYSPVVRIESVRLVILIAMFLGLECTHVDFVTAFLNGDLVDVVIYMEQPEGYEDGTGRVCRLRKGLYGLKQASKIWNDTLHKVLVELGFVQCTYDAGVYWRRRNGRVMFLTVYVDDIVMAGTAADVREVILELGRRFKLKSAPPSRNGGELHAGTHAVLLADCLH